MISPSPSFSLCLLLLLRFIGYKERVINILLQLSSIIDICWWDTVSFKLNFFPFTTNFFLPDMISLSLFSYDLLLLLCYQKTLSSASSTPFNFLNPLAREIIKIQGQAKKVTFQVVEILLQILRIRIVLEFFISFAFHKPMQLVLFRWKWHYYECFLIV
mgnify:CR=1 FL=1